MKTEYSVVGQNYQVERQTSYNSKKYSSEEKAGFEPKIGNVGEIDRTGDACLLLLLQLARSICALTKLWMLSRNSSVMMCSLLPSSSGSADRFPSGSDPPSSENPA
jgi:hypothetical protein